MKRREFVNKSFNAGALTAASLSIGKFPDLFALTPDDFDLVAIKGGEPHTMFDQAIDSIGGMKSFVKNGSTVVVKPNIGWDVIPERAANTNPLLVKRIVEHCFEAGAKEVYVFDHTCDDWNSCYATSGIERAVKDAGGKIVPGNSERYYEEVIVTKGKRLTEAKVHELILESDVFINVPVLKSHGSAGLTISMKNLMGIVWDRRYWHRNDLHQCIADFTSYRKPDLNVIDAYYVMRKNGPRGVSKADVLTMKSQIISPDIVAADAAAAKLFGLEPQEIDYMKIANEMKLGEIDLNKLNINRIIL
jgi:uncharacterized protein (DUF362 family)